MAKARKRARAEQQVAMPRSMQNRGAQDRRNAVVFATNPNGAEFDALITDESGAFNADWRAVWTVRAQRVPEGWSAEIAIPFRSLRYPSSSPDGWGLNVWRMRRPDQ